MSSKQCELSVLRVHIWPKQIPTGCGDEIDPPLDTFISFDPKELQIFKGPQMKIQTILHIIMTLNDQNMNQKCKINATTFLHSNFSTRKLQWKLSFITFEGMTITKQNLAYLFIRYISILSQNFNVISSLL